MWPAQLSCRSHLVSRVSSEQLFHQAVELLRKLDPEFSLYVANDTLCLMHGPSHDDSGHPRRDHIVASTSRLRISGGDW